MKMELLHNYRMDRSKKMRAPAAYRCRTHGRKGPSVLVNMLGKVVQCSSTPEPIDALFNILDKNKEKVCTLAKRDGGWEIWLQCELYDVLKNDWLCEQPVTYKMESEKFYKKNSTNQTTVDFFNKKNKMIELKVMTSSRDADKTLDEMMGDTRKVAPDVLETNQSALVIGVFPMYTDIKLPDLKTLATELSGKKHKTKASHNKTLKITSNIVIIKDSSYPITMVVWEVST